MVVVVVSGWPLTWVARVVVVEVGRVVVEVLIVRYT
jgi:hypothetical protein